MNTNLLAHFRNAWMSTIATTSCLLAACGASPDTTPAATSSEVQEPVVTSHVMPVARPAATQDGSAMPSTHGLVYGGGPVMSGTVNVYYIFYGNWTGNTGPTILTDWARSVGG